MIVCYMFVCSFFCLFVFLLFLFFFGRFSVVSFFSLLWCVVCVSFGQLFVVSFVHCGFVSVVVFIRCCGFVLCLFRDSADVSLFLNLLVSPGLVVSSLFLGVRCLFVSLSRC